MRDNTIPWSELAKRINQDQLTPFLGAGISRPPLPSGRELAAVLASIHDCPLSTENLMEVAQYVATTIDGFTAKSSVADYLDQRGSPEYTTDQPHSILAGFPIRIYLTTNYDAFLQDALTQRGKNPHTEMCRWNSLLQKQKSYLADHDPTSADPVVFHIHGHRSNPDSLVLTEDDYLDFIVNVRRFESSSDPHTQVLPDLIQERITNTSLIFIGYGLRDWNLRVLLRALVRSADTSSKKLSVSVQLEPEDSFVDSSEEEAKSRAISYLTSYFQDMKIGVYWGSANEFLRELRDAWHQLPDAGE